MNDIFNRDIFKMVYVIFCLKAVSIDSPCLLNTFTGSQYYINGDHKQSVHEWVPDRIWIKAPTCKTLLYLVLIKHMDNNVSFKCFPVCTMSHFLQAELIHCPRCCDMTESLQVTCCSSEKTLPASENTSRIKKFDFIKTKTHMFFSSFLKPIDLFNNSWTLGL